MKDPIWTKMLEYESIDLIKNKYATFHGRKPSSQKVRQIVSNFYQGREYFKSAKSSDISVRPLLLYYGVMALSKGLILFLVSVSKEERLKPGHGIEVHNWGEIVTNRTFEKAHFRLNEGTFNDFLKATEDRNFLRAGSSGVNWNIKLTRPTVGYKFTLLQILNCFPDLSQVFKTCTGEEMKFCKMRSLICQDDEIFPTKIIIEGQIDDHDINQYFPIAYANQIEVSRSKGETVVQYSGNWAPNFTQLWSSAFQIIGDACIIPSVDEDIGFNILSAMYAISYFLGMLARYFPTTWISLRTLDKGDSLFPMIYALLNLIEEKFPVAISEFIEESFKEKILQTNSQSKQE